MKDSPALGLKKDVDAFLFWHNHPVNFLLRTKQHCHDQKGLIFRLNAPTTKIKLFLLQIEKAGIE